VSTTFGIDPVKPEHIAVVWPEVAPLFERAIERSDSWRSVESLRADVESGHTTLWLICSGNGLVAAFITGVITAARGKILDVIALGGSRMSQWFKQFDERLTEIAKAEDCTSIVGIGRRGWKRWLGNLGWAEGPVTMMRVV